MDFFKSSVKFLIFGILRYVVTLALTFLIAFYLMGGQKFPPDFNSIKKIVSGFQSLQATAKILAQNSKTNLGNPISIEDSSILRKNSSEVSDQLIDEIQEYNRLKSMIGKQASGISNTFFSDENLPTAAILKRAPDSETTSPLDVSKILPRELLPLPPNKKNEISPDAFDKIINLIIKTRYENRVLKYQLAQINNDLNQLRQQLENLKNPKEKPVLSR